MELFNFYLKIIFGGYGLPYPQDICGNGEQIKNYCFSLLYSLNTVTVVSILVIAALIFTKRSKLALKAFILTLILIPLAFLTVDHILKELSDVANYGSDMFVTLFYLWLFIAASAYLKAYIFRKEEFYTSAFLLITLVFTVIFIFTGRGTIEHITPLFGGLLAKFSFNYLSLSYIAKLVGLLVVTGFTLWLVEVITRWIISGKFSNARFIAIAKLTLYFCIIALIPLLSLPFGEMVNRSDLKAAESYIDSMVTKVEKYKLENGEYPRVITDIIDNGENQYPRLLERHDYLSYGTKGAYYFSRADKYCFVFQNPARKLGYYSRVTGRDQWKFFSYKGSLDEEYINVCDEQYSGSDNVIGGSLGLTDPYSEIEQMAAEVGAQTSKPAISLKANQVLKGIINEYGKEDPTIFNQEDLKKVKEVQ